MSKSLQSLKTTLLNVGHVHLNYRWNHDNVISPFTRLYLIEAGFATLYHHEKLFNLKPGYLYLIPSFTYSRYTCRKYMEQLYVHFLEEIGAGLSIYNIQHFQYEVKATPLVKQLFRRLLHLNPGRVLVQDDPKVYDNPQMLKTFEKKNGSLSPSHYIETNGILQILLSQFVKEESLPFHPSDVKHNRITQTIYYISEHLSDALSVTELAQRCHINADYFSRLFKQQTGLRPIEYIQQKRIERARILLTTTNHSLQSVADMVGLPNISYFNKLFLKLTKKTPREYKKESPER